MKCPACETDMVLIDVHSIEIDRCPSCGGIVLDKGETEAIDSLGLAQVIEGGVTTDHVHRTNTARCHTCNKDMVELKGPGDIEYDWCESCERLFFDRGELSAFDAFSDG